MRPSMFVNVNISLTDDNLPSRLCVVSPVSPAGLIHYGFSKYTEKTKKHQKEFHRMS